MAGRFQVAAVLVQIRASAYSTARAAATAIARAGISAQAVPHRSLVEDITTATITPTVRHPSGLSSPPEVAKGAVTAVAIAAEAAAVVAAAVAVHRSGLSRAVVEIELSY